MCSNATVASHPIHPMLVPHPIAGGAGTPVGLLVHAVKGEQPGLDFEPAVRHASPFRTFHGHAG